jgi:hypothetical protein
VLPVRLPPWGRHHRPHQLDHVGRRLRGRPGIEGRLGVVLDAELDHLGHLSLTNERDRIVRLVEEATSEVDEEAARFGQLHPAAGAVEELDAQLLLERLICWLNAGWAMCSRSAARPKCNSSATVRK